VAAFRLTAWLVAALIAVPCLACAIGAATGAHACCPPKVEHHCGGSEPSPKADCSRAGWAAEKAVSPEAPALAISAEPAPAPPAPAIFASLTPEPEPRSGAPPGLLAARFSALLI
jgi:hypothetical protein